MLTSECWLWEGKTLGDYGVARGVRGANGFTHRLAYEVFFGTIPEKHDLDHLCRVRNCYNPFHLEPVTRQENLRRSPLNNPTECRVCGSPFPQSYRNGRRDCAECHRNRERERRST